MTNAASEVQLDDSVLERLAGVICGDDTGFYRSGPEIIKFFERAGWRRVGEIDGSRRQWTQDKLRQRRNDSTALKQVILRLADPREYLGEDEAKAGVLKELNELLAVEGLQIAFGTGNKPELTTYEPSTARLESENPLQLTVDLTDIVSDPGFGAQLKARLDEAHLCWNSGACTAAIIMLGSLLEGVLYDVALTRHTSGPQPSDRLEALINLAKEKRWLAQDVVDYAHVLRNHRNLVHPKKQLTQGYAPSDQIVRIAWNVVVAALNGLAGSRSA